jgi:hypothetical protein
MASQVRFEVSRHSTRARGGSALIQSKWCSGCSFRSCVLRDYVLPSWLRWTQAPCRRNDSAASWVPGMKQRAEYRLSREAPPCRVQPASAAGGSSSRRCQRSTSATQDFNVRSFGVGEYHWHILHERINLPCLWSVCVDMRFATWMTRLTWLIPTRSSRYDMALCNCLSQPDRLEVADK